MRVIFADIAVFQKVAWHEYSPVSSILTDKICSVLPVLPANVIPFFFHVISDVGQAFAEQESVTASLSLTVFDGVRVKEAGIKRQMLLFRWGSPGFAERRNLKEIFCGIRNSSNFSTKDGILHPYRTRIFSKMISGTRSFHEIL